jgi:hypothetical protein
MRRARRAAYVEPRAGSPGELKTEEVTNMRGAGRTGLAAVLYVVHGIFIYGEDERALRT